MTNDQPYIRGNRMPLPEGMPGPHFLYKAKGPVLDPQDVLKVVNATKSLVEVHGLYPSQIEVYSPHNLGTQHSVEAKEALLRISEQMRPQGLTVIGSPTLLVCEWASLHEDSSFAGNSFFSAVLHTGPYPYILQTAHTMVRSEELIEQTVVATTRTLRQGDYVVFDPTTPHYAVPAHLHEDCLLILLQMEIQEETSEEREQLLKVLPPVEADRNDQAIFEGIGV